MDPSRWFRGWKPFFSVFSFGGPMDDQRSLQFRDAEREAHVLLRPEYKKFLSKNGTLTIKLITSRKREYIESILASLRNAFSGEVTAHFGTIHNYLGMCLDFSRKGKLSINVKGYISKILRNHNITSSAKAPTSGKINFKSYRHNNIHTKHERYYH